MNNREWFSTPDFLFNIAFTGQSAGTVQEIEYGHTADGRIPQKAEQIGNIAKQAKTDDSRKNDLRIVVNRDFPGGGKAISCGDGELAAGSTETGSNQN